jgi:predicted RecB family nuclease
MIYECMLEAGTVNDAPQETVDVVRDYNEDDCRSTESLRNWLSS